MLGLLPLETVGFAATQFAHFRRADAVPPELSAFVAAHPGDYRVQNLLEPNNGFLIGAPDLWATIPDCQALRRIDHRHPGRESDEATPDVTFRSLPPLYGLLRLRYVFTGTDSGPKVYEIPGAMERIQLVSSYRVLPNRDTLFSAMSQPGFDPRQTVLLESQPGFGSSQDPSPGHIRIVASSADQLTVEADIASLAAPGHGFLQPGLACATARRKQPVSL